MPHGEASATESIRIAARFRPSTASEIAAGARELRMKLGDDGKSVWVGPDEATGVYTVDVVLPPSSAQVQVYSHAASELVEAVLQGTHGSIIAYGPTGGGKTFSMVGDPSDERLAGLIPRAAHHLFGELKAASPGAQPSVHCSYLEIYKEVVRDLLDQPPVEFKPPAKRASLRDTVEASRPKLGRGLAIRESPEHGIFVEGLTQAAAHEAADVIECLAVGNANRFAGIALHDGHAARSHCILTLTVRQKFEDGSSTYARLSFADLAGSEKTAHATGETLAEARLINASIMCLSNVVAALSDGKEYVPYRDSKLTRILQESLGGNSKTVILLTCALADEHAAETHEALRFSQRAQRIKNSARVNSLESAADIRTLKQDLEAARGLVSALSEELGGEARALVAQLGGKGDGSWASVRSALEALAAARATEVAKEKEAAEADQRRLEGKAERLEAEAAAAAEHIRRGEEARARAEAAAAQQAAEVSHLKQEAERRAREVHTQLEEAASRHAAEVVRLHEEAEDRERGMQARLEEAAAQHAAEVVRLHEEAEEREREVLSRMEKAAAQHAAELAAARQQAEAKQREMQSQLEDASAQHAAEVVRLHEEAEERERETQARLEAAIAQHVAELTRVEQQAERNQRERQVQLEEEAAKHAAELVRLHEGAQARERELRTQVEQTEATLAVVKKAAEQQEEELRAHVADATAQHAAEVARLHEEARAREERLEAVGAQATSGQTQAQQLSEELAHLQGDLKANQQLFVQQAAETESLRSVLKQRDSELSQLDAEKKQLQSELHRLRQELQAREVQRQSVENVRLQHSDAELRCLSQDLAEVELAAGSFRRQFESQQEEVRLLYQLLGLFQALQGMEPKVRRTSQQAAIDSLRQQVEEVEGRQITKAEEDATSHRLMDQLSVLNTGLSGLTGSLDCIAQIAEAEDAEVRDFSRFKLMLQELQQAVQASHRDIQAGGGVAVAPPLSIKDSAAFKQAGGMLRGWIEQFEQSNSTEAPV